MKELYRFCRALVQPSELAERHRPSGVSPCFHTEATSVRHYLELSRDAVSRARTDLDDEQRDWIIEGNSAFELKPEQTPAVRRGIVMVHGLTDSPFQFRDLAPIFRDQGFHVLALQLPGHATRPGDLLDIRWQDWLAALQHLLDLLEQEVDELYLAGFSIGASLCIYQALRDRRIKGLFLFAPALKINPVAPLACVMANASVISKRLAWLDVLPDGDCFKYESLSNRSICEVYRLLGALQRLQALAELKMPVFVAASKTDAVVDADAVLEWFATLKGPKQMLWYSDGISRLPAGVKFVPAALPERAIRTFSHTSLLQAPDNPHYGENGSYFFCTHYYRLNQEKYRLCKQGKEQCLGEMFGETEDCQVIRRLSYNPLFDGLLKELSGFLESTCLPRSPDFVKS